MPKLYHLRHFLFLLIVGLPATSVFATHNRAGEISIEQVGDCTNSLTVRATITTYTKASSRPADRDTLTICWGDGICERVARANGPGSPPQGIVLENDTKRNLYIATHTFPARGTYVISMTDPNRNGGILNVNFPNSDQIKFHIQTTYTFPNPQFQGCNNTPVLLQPPIDIGCVGQTFTHNPNAYDADGDSLSYEFIVPLQDAGVEVPNYQFPDQISPGPMNNLTIDRETGDIVWDAPQRAGEYNLAMIIVEYRDGIPIDTIIRDMQINIESCDNEPPVVETGVEEVCVVAGELLSFEVIATAPEFELGQQVRLTALGGPFEVDISPAVFEPADDAFLDDPVIKRFSWQTACEHISDQFYSVVFKATDNFFGDTTGLATLKTVRIKVVGPPPRDLSAQTEKEKVTISWALPYVCEDAANDFFRGFTVWRKINSLTFPIDTCMPGLEGRGYEKLTQVPIADQRDGRYFYEDTQVERGKTYCYRVLAQFAKTTPGGLYTYNTVESLPSGEICAQLSRDAPLITNVSVLSTSPSDGQILVCWSKPEAEDLDTVLNPGPYRYEVLRAAGMTDNPDDFTSIGVNFVSETFAEANDTCFVDDGLASSEMPFSYLINFYVGPSEDLLGSTSGASSVFLDIVPTDRANQLSWNEVVPWNNFSYAVFRQNSSGAFEVLDTVNTSSYTDRGLENGQTYCYRIESIGSYGIAGIVDPILNFSQENCGTPIDDVPPCPPFLQVDNVCDEIDNCRSEQDLENTLRWSLPEDCENFEDVAGYNVFFSETEGGELQPLAQLEGGNVTSLEHSPERGIAGCYAVTAIDTSGNESALGNIVCVDNCPTYQLPNAFTPNGDGQNDMYQPFPFCFIERVEFQAYNRWGQLVFETTDPNINWMGTNKNGEDLAEGVYFYTCRVFEQRVSGTEEQEEILRGYIELIRGR